MTFKVIKLSDFQAQFGYEYTLRMNKFRPVGHRSKIKAEIFDGKLFTYTTFGRSVLNKAR